MPFFLLSTDFLAQQGRFKEAAPFFVEAAQTGSSWGLNEFSGFLEIIGEFEAAEAFRRRDLSSYPEIGPFDWWGTCFRTNSERLDEATLAVLDRYDNYSAAAPDDEATRQRNRIENHQVLFPCYCMDLPIPKSLGEDPFLENMFLADDGLSGFLAYFDALEKKDEERAQRIIRLLRGQLWYEKSNPFANAKDSQPGQTANWSFPAHVFQTFAALVELDQRSPQPGNLREDEIDHLLRKNYSHELKPDKGMALLYLLGRYYDLCGKKEKATRAYGRALGIRPLTDFYTRSLVVKELRKSGMSNEEYVLWSQSDPELPRQEISYATPDVLCRYLFRDYSATPAKSRLAEPVAKTEVEYPDYGEPLPMKRHWYAASRVDFRGRTIPAEDLVACLAISQKGSWSFSGISQDANMALAFREARPDGTIPIFFGRSPHLNGLASFHKNKLVLVIALDPKNTPETMTPSTDSDCVRIEWDQIPASLKKY